MLDRETFKKLDLSNSILSERGKAKLVDIITGNKDAFVAEDGLIGKYNGQMFHRIDLVPEAQPFKIRPYRTGLAQREEIEKQIKNMLKQKIIQPSNSPFCSPIILVRKADNSWRFAVDYRRLNSLTKKQTYFLPLIQDILDLIGGKRIYSSFDFQSGFHQIPLHPPHYERTAFATFMGLFEFLRMPFGLCGAPETFQRTMESLRKELTAAFFVYMDDVVLASDDEESHLRDIRHFLRVIAKHGMKLKLDKCKFARAEIKYLGYLISENGLRIDPKNIECVKNFRIPKTLTEVRSVIGAISYFRKFIKNFAGIAKPLYDLTKGNTMGEWKEEHTKALETLKEKITSAPVLATPILNKSFIVETDASKHAIAACLLQENAQKEIHPILFASRILNKCESKYPAIETEALAIAFAAKEFAPYLEGTRSMIITDNSALCSLLRKKDLTGENQT
jgi:hypothetical protein